MNIRCLNAKFLAICERIKKNGQHDPREPVNNLQYHMDQSGNFFEGDIVPLMLPSLYVYMSQSDRFVAFWKCRNQKKMSM